MQEPEPTFQPAHPIFEITPEERLVLWGAESEAERKRREDEAKQAEGAREIDPAGFSYRDPELLNPDRWFKTGRIQLERGQYPEAVHAFERAAMLDPQSASIKSFLGLALALGRQDGRRAISLCEQAAKDERVPEHFLNLGRAYQTSGRKLKAFQAFQTGLALNRFHPELRFAVKGMGERKSPFFPFLPRGHRLNIVAGRTLKALHLR